MYTQGNYITIKNKRSEQNIKEASQNNTVIRKIFTELWQSMIPNIIT